MSNRLSQLALEVLVLPSTPISLRLSQLPLDVLHSPQAAVPAAQLSQLPLDVLLLPLPPSPALAQLSQLPVEVLLEGEVTPALEAGVTQLVIELGSQHPGAPAVTQLAVEVAQQQLSTLDVTQFLIEIVRPRVLEPLPVSLNPGWLAWVEWPEAPGARSGPTPPIVAYSDWDLQDPPGYYKGFKQARVERFGEAARTLSEARTGDWQGAACDFRLSDFDRLLRTKLASDTERYWTVGNFILRMVTRPVRAALGEALTIFVGPLRRADPVPPLSFELLLEDIVGHTMLNDEHLIPQRVIDATEWTTVVEVMAEGAKGHPVPIIYGVHERTTGAVAPIYLGVEPDGSDHVWLVAGHFAAVLDLFVNGVSVLGTEGVDWTVPGVSGPAFEEIAGRRYTLLRGRKGIPPAAQDPMLYANNAGPGLEYFETWIASYPAGGAGAAVRWDVNGTTPVHGGTRALVGVDLRDGELVRGHFGLAGTEDAIGAADGRGYVVNDYENLRLWLMNGTNFWDDATLEINFLAGPAPLVPIGTVVVVAPGGTYGLDETNVTTWQELVIPIVDFAVEEDFYRADYMVIRKTGLQDVTLTLDDIMLEGGPETEVTQADAAASGSASLTVNVSGWTTTGDADASGVVLNAIADQYQHWLINYVATPEGYQTGGSLPNPTSDLFDRVVTVVHEASFAAAKAQGAARYPPGGYRGAAIFGATPGERLPVRQWIGRWNLSADCRFGVTRYGELFIVMTDPTAEDHTDAPVFDEVLDVLEGSFAIDVQWTAQATRVPFKASYNYATGEWTVVRDAEDNALSEAYGKPSGILGATREYWFISDSDQAKNVAEHEVQRIGHPPKVLQFETNLDRMVTQELGGYVTVRHFAGVGPDALRLCQIEELTIGPGTRRARVRALDVTHLIGETIPAAGG